MSSPAGRAPEALQSEHLAALRGPNAEQPSSTPTAPVAGVSASPPSPPLATPEPPSVEPVAQVANPLVAQLEMLPDEDLEKAAVEKGIRIDRRWGRERLIYEIMQAAANPPPPPPAAPTNG